MDITTKLYLKAIAGSLFNETYSEPCPPVSVQRAQQILKILSDGQWHTASEMLETMNEQGGKQLKSAEYVRSILNTSSTGWAIESHKRSGYRQPDDADGDCRACRGTGYKGQPENDCPSCGGRGSYWACSLDTPNATTKVQRI